MNSIPQWLLITFGIVLILISVFILLWPSFFKKSKEEVQNYKNKQLELYKKQNPKFKGDYKQAKLILPWSQKVKITFWPTISVALLIIGASLLGVQFGFFIR